MDMLHFVQLRDQVERDSNMTPTPKLTEMEKRAILGSVLMEMGQHVTIEKPRWPEYDRKRLPPAKVNPHEGETATTPAPNNIIDLDNTTEAIELRRAKLREERLQREEAIRQQEQARQLKEAKTRLNIERSHRIAAVKDRLQRRRLLAEHRALEESRLSAEVFHDKPITTAELVKPEAALTNILRGTCKGIFPGHPLFGIFKEWLGDRKGTKRLVKEFLAQLKLTCV